MKKVLEIFLVSFLTVGLASATSHEKKETALATEASKESSKTDVKDGEVKQVCVEINGKKKCKKMKMHHKFEGTKVPTPVKKRK